MGSMVSFLRRRKSPQLKVVKPVSVGEEKRIYAIGDIHGRADLLVELLEAIHEDNGRRPYLPVEIIFLGDLVDRGLQSEKVISCVMDMAKKGAPVRFLKGNHEEVFIEAARGDVRSTRFFCRIGGRETLLSYGLTKSEYGAMDFEQLTDWMRAHVPSEHIDFLDSFEDMIEIGDYLFVHAGIRPDIPLPRQTVRDLRWIRSEFLNSTRSFGKMVVHGHTPTEEIDEQANRIGIDTGAYFSGKLTALCLEKEERWMLSTAA